MSDAPLSQQQRQYLNHFPGGLFVYRADETQQFGFISDSFLEMLGYSEDAFRARFHNCFSEMIYEPDREAVFAKIDAYADGVGDGERDRCVYRVPHADGHLIWLHDEGRLITNPAGERLYYVSVVDITATQAVIHSQQLLLACAKLLVSHHHFHDVVQQVLQSILQYYSGARGYIFEFDWEHGTTSNTFESCADGVSAEIDGLQDLPIGLVSVWTDAFRSGRDFIAIPDVELLAQDPVRRNEYETLKRQGIRSLLAVPIYFDEVLHGFLGVDDPVQHMRDENFLITLTYFICNEMEKYRLHEQLRTLSYVDHLTGFLNRNAFNELLDKAQRHPMNRVGVAFSDINGLKYTNDHFGHAYGDRLIRRYGDLIRMYFSQQNVYRISGDEFVFVCADTDEREFERRLRALEQEIQNTNHGIAAIGYTWQDVCADLQTPLRQAEQMMYVAKERHYADRERCYTRIDENVLGTLLAPENQDRYVLFLQPYQDAVTGALRGVEGLVRRLEPDGRVQDPSEFVPILEQQRVVGELDRLMLAKGCELLRRWQAEGHTVPFLALNCSRLTFAEPDVAKTFAAICAEFGVPPSRIKLEIPAAAGSMNAPLRHTQLNKLRSAGFTLAADNMGSDFSSLSMLTCEAIDTVKLDAGLFPLPMDTPRCRALAQTVIDLCHTMGQACIAVGVEAPELLDALREMGCDMVQGYLQDKPMPAAEFERKYLRK